MKLRNEKQRKQIYMHQEQSHDTKIYVVQQYVPMSMELPWFLLYQGEKYNFQYNKLWHEATNKYPKQ